MCRQCFREKSKAMGFVKVSFVAARLREGTDIPVQLN
ncbi:uncharacterized protein COLE_01278 [Cutaneotrichosporon oleaginosum]|nr:hypothetical protein COLE_01278 [Cutaneotrichosporon oleaginosum]